MKNEDELEMELEMEAETQGAANGWGCGKGEDEGPRQKVLCVRGHECVRNNKSCKGAEWPSRATGLRPSA